MENKTISRWVFVILLLAVAGLFFGGMCNDGGEA